ncbi:hypothetical protein FIT71_04265 [Candidatus Methylopumilus universalis]|uniref:hypothetical protein n=1 Tax=Candidatus Methylopumilus universalis TaxID=2588536 RepID=UPI0011222A73|nr:hypothetical protein [Candidatus Methylopumilus universalis]QDC46240.1 hypothetical protein FIT71_04265 [Candidatus Methylopumilus universalis]
MNFALFSVGISSLLSFLQLAILSYILNVDTYVNFRAFINTMNNAAPFLCLGFDSAMPMLKKSNENFPFFWSLLLLYLLFFIIFFAIAIISIDNSKFQVLLFGLTASLSLCGTTIIANLKRSNGNFKDYFLSLNILDKFLRFLIIIVLAIFFDDFINWAISASILFLMYLIFAAYRANIKPLFNFQILFRHIKKTFPFVVSSLGLFALTRFPFYAAFFFEGSYETAKVDFWLLASLLLLVPVLNSSKIEESRSGGNIYEYIHGMKNKRLTISLQEFLILISIFIATVVGIKIGKTIPQDIFEVILPLTLGMLFIGSIPNYAQLLCFDLKPKLGVVCSLTLLAILIGFCLCHSFLFKLPISIIFLISTILYFILGLYVSMFLKIKFQDFFRVKRMIALGLISILSLVNLV